MNLFMKVLVLGSLLTASGVFAAGEVGPDQWPIVEEIDDVIAVSFFSTNYMESSFNAPPGIVLTNPFSIDIVMYNPSVVAHEGLISWTDRFLADASAQYFKFGCGTDTGEGDACYRRGTDLPWNTVPPADTWQHIALTTSGGSDAEVRAYLAGVLDNLTNVGNWSVMSGQKILLGGMWWRDGIPTHGLYHPYEGSMAEVRIYDYELSADNVVWLNDDGEGTEPPAAPIVHLIAEDLDEGPLDYWENEGTYGGFFGIPEPAIPALVIMYLAGLKRCCSS